MPKNSSWKRSDLEYINKYKYIQVDVYFTIVVKNMRDSVPKSIGYFLVKRS